jgi:phage shock protein A
MSLAIQRAENKTDQMRAKAGAIDELAEAGVLDDLTGSRDDIDRELAKISVSQSVESELAALKGGSAGSGASPREGV